MADAKRDNNSVPTLLAVSNADGVTPVVLWADPTTHRLLVQASAGTLAGLTDVTLTTPAQGDVLYYNGTKWVNLAAGTSGYFLKTQGAGANPVWAPVSAAAGGLNTQVQYNSSNALAGAAGFVFDGTSAVTLGVAGTSVGAVKFQNATSGTITLSPVTGALGTVTLSLPAATDTLVGKATTDTLTNKTLDTAGAGNVLKINGTQVSAVTGTGSVVLAASPALTGTPTAPTPAVGDNTTTIATTAFVYQAVLGQNFKEAARLATTAALPANTYNNGASGVGATLTAVATGVLTIDGTTVALNDRVLVKNEVTGANNGIYTCTTAGAIGVAYILTRATDANQSAEFKTGDSLFITAGSSNSTTTWAYTGIDSPTMGTTSLTYAQVAGQGSFVGGAGITITGNSIAITAPVTVALGGTNATSAGITAFNNITGYTAAGATGTTSTNLVFSTSPAITTPKVVTNIQDTNGNILINIGATASAVNYVKVTNAATGTAGPILAADGETNVDLKIAAKGTGKVHYTSGTYPDLTSDTDGATVTFDMSVSNTHTVTLGGNRTLALSNVATGQCFMLNLKQDATGSRTVTWFSGISWPGGTVPTLTTTASKTDTFGFQCTGAGAYLGYIIGQNL